MADFSLHSHWAFHTWRAERVMQHLQNIDLTKMPLVEPDILMHDRQPITKAEMYFFHIVLAEEVWKSRAMGKPFALPLLFNRQIAMDLWHETLQFWKEKLEHPNDTFSYSTTKGEIFHNEISDILLHLTDHATYHTGQLMATLKQHGLPTIGTVYVDFLRR